ncbi:TPA: hypothetical protein ACKUJQ_001337, partial [Neisseria gonorrhoeae]
MHVVTKGAACFGGQVFARGGQNGFVGRAALGFDVNLYRAGGAAHGAGVCDFGGASMAWASYAVRGPA